MTGVLALHTAARRYCLEHHALWWERYITIMRSGADRQPDGYHYTAEALATFPRYNVLHAIRVELERIDPATLADLEETRQLLILAGQTAEDDFTRRPIGQIDQRAVAEEREAFARYIAALAPSDLRAIEPLPFRRVLTREESQQVWSRFRERWQINQGYWYPLAHCTLSDVVAFRARAFEQAVPTDRLQDILRSHGIERVWEFRESGPEYEEDVSLFEPCYSGAEGYWSSGLLEWIVYASHEDSVTVGGWLLKELKPLWPTWEHDAWTGPFC